MRKALISVIIPTYNEERNIANLPRQISGVKRIEVLVIDGGSSDQTAKICKGFPVRFLTSQKGRGIQLNAGAKEASGDVLFFLHADSVINAEVFNAIRTAIHNKHRWGCCSLVFDEQKLFYRVLAFFSTLRAKLFSVCFGDQGIFCTRELYFSCGGFPEIPIMEDLAFSQKLRRVSAAKVLSSEIVTSSRRFKAGGPWRTLLLMQKLKLYYFLGKSPQQLAAMYMSAGKKKTADFSNHNE